MAIKLKGKHALVTGASTGIGAAFARLLAENGSHLVLVARDEARLEALAKELEAEHGVQTEVLPADLADESQLARVEKRLGAEPRIEILVNNAGFGDAGDFGAMPLASSEGQIRVNVLALVRLAHAALPGMRTARCGGILNVSSTAGFFALPENAIYGATKAFVTTFSQALAEEVRAEGVNVTVLCPGFTRTEFQERAKVDVSRIPEFAWQSAEEVARAGITDLLRGSALCIPGVHNRVMAGMTQLVPRSLLGRIGGMATRNFG